VAVSGEKKKKEEKMGKKKRIGTRTIFFHSSAGRESLAEPEYAGLQDGGARGGMGCDGA